MKSDSCGNVLWAKRIGNVGFDGSFGINTDLKGNVYLTGFFTSPTITFGSIILSNNGGYDTFTVKFDPSGNVLWAKQAGGSSLDAAYGISSDASNNVIITGIFDSPSIAFGSTTLTNTSATHSDIFVAKYDSSGNVLWAKKANGSGDEFGNSVSTDASGNIFIAKPGVRGNPVHKFG